MPAFKVNVSEDLAKAFDRLARSHGRARSKMLRGIIEQAVGDEPKPAVLTRAPPYAPPTGRSIKVRVYLACDDADWVEGEALEMGLTRSSWIAALVHHRATLKPRFSREGELALIAVHTDLRRIRLEVAGLRTVCQSLDLADPQTSVLQEFDQDLSKHMRALRAAFEGNLAYWAVGR